MIRRHYKRILALAACVSVLVALMAGATGTTDWNAVRVWLENRPNPGYFRVVSIADGDTIVVDMNGVKERIRLIGIDTPEKNHPEKPVQCFAQAASAFTKKLIGTHDVRLEADPTNDNRDRYDRLLRYVYLPDGTLVNYEVVAQGYGFAYLGFPFQKQNDFKKAEDAARERSLGLWDDCNIDFSERSPSTNAVE